MRVLLGTLGERGLALEKSAAAPGEGRAFAKCHGQGEGGDKLNPPSIFIKGLE